jgi:hypothetical protein
MISFFVRGFVRQTPNDIDSCNIALTPYAEAGSPGDKVLDGCLAAAKLTGAESPRVRSQAELMVSACKGIKAREMSVFLLKEKLAFAGESFRSLKAAQIADPTNELAFMTYAKLLVKLSASAFRGSVEDTLKIKVADEVRETRVALDRFTSPEAAAAKQALDALPRR